MQPAQPPATHLTQPFQSAQPAQQTLPPAPPPPNHVHAVAAALVPKKRKRKYLSTAKERVVIRKESLTLDGIAKLTDDEAKLYIRAINDSMPALDLRRIPMPSKGFSRLKKQEAIRAYFTAAAIEEFVPN